ncbi:TetR/AcrR family transcriptional regulator [Granulicella sibirica]|uniref:Transcriptional regulator, TetR family n=1 Tax=Granulicella sibirica TaxID=2479048 RepID=A0A4Q0T3H9_9BACT|nr:TetR/AcrR family transcriptional regulator [Granulicella sibirica]RXH57827.1 Transcriptional regulator, TetR family [Granulicella sibirica]
MKVSKETMAEHREKILASAAQRFRERGFDGIGVAELMKEVGLTHGGFYGHFASKEELVALASERAMDDSRARWEKIFEDSPENPLGSLMDYFVSRHHCSLPGSGCLVAAVGSEVGRQPESVRNAVTAGLRKTFDLLGKVVSARTKESRRKKAITAYASMVGAVVLARASNDPALSQEILQAIGGAVATDAV